MTNRAKTRSCGFVLIVPAKRKFKFINKPKKAASDVNNPTTRPRPISNSPYVIAYDQVVAYGNTAPLRNPAYHMETSG